MKRVLLTTVMSLMMCMGIYAQDYMNAPKSSEKLIGTVSLESYTNSSGGPFIWATKEKWYFLLLEKAKQEYPNKIVDIRNMVLGKHDNSDNTYKSPAIGKVVDLGGNPETQSIESLSKAMDKALRNVREGSRVAIDMVTVSGGVSINREDLKDQIIDDLLDKGYKVVAKDYLEKMYEEQEAQQSGIYNENTTVKENNFSAVGYYINVKVTETSLRVQVVNVSTGEYEGNATVNF